jgi:hypothetical protein
MHLIFDVAHVAKASVHRLRNLGEQVPTEDPAEDDDRHAPERDRDDAAELEGRVEKDQERTERTQEDVKLEPVAETTSFRQPLHSLAQGVEGDADRHHQRPRDPVGVAYQPGRLEELVALDERPLGERRAVVVQAELRGNGGDDQPHGNEQPPEQSASAHQRDSIGIEPSLTGMGHFDCCVPSPDPTRAGAPPTRGWRTRDGFRILVMEVCMSRSHDCAHRDSTSGGAPRHTGGWRLLG